MRYNVPKKISVRLSETLLKDLKQIVAEGPRWLTLSDHVQNALVNYRVLMQAERAKKAAAEKRRVRKNAPHYPPRP